MFQITRWTKHVTDDHKPIIKPLVDPKGKMVHKFRILDDDDIVYGYGFSSSDSSFAPLDRYMDDYGVTSIQYLNPVNKKWETL